MTAGVALVLVSHSADVAAGTAEIAGQMAPDVLLLPAGGIPEGIGTSVDRVMAAVEEGLQTCPGGVVVMTDLGSAVLTTDLVLEMVDDAERVKVPRAPFVEGAVAAAVAAQQGGDLAAVEAAALEAGVSFAPEGAAAPEASDEVDAAGQDGQVTALVTLRNPLGLHARTAAQVARAVADAGVPVRIEGVDGASVLALMALGTTGGQEITVSATGPDAQSAVDTVVALVEGGFGEV
ncbi:dihydroxyacetone kinase phosphoryl donor subunit DhaM [Actinotalea sp. M2MS4P-6]|uniref:dihydroxyacetone kinase phosphoryl donor subunit DhaM n=1 Tax=Actinotalea sp. M2MS4P-6 TaxID=2983762 RepID=UPI0021E44070|nr:dihydroxyacetone kinase phosphoryl donor subunit DhaM [Actinotalea sp. M2MS4P-6]MCV2396074.1 dihydroxyacetone kinase phosphoryl donor subunit DhaM [Actinotalea sp. M2MS4P-6]